MTDTSPTNATPPPPTSGWWVRLDDGRDVVLTVAPAPHVRLLRYEQDLTGAEALHPAGVRRGTPGSDPTRAAPRDADLGEWLFTGRLPG